MEHQFLLSHSGEKIFEVLKFTEEPRSWFIEESVQKGIDKQACWTLKQLNLSDYEVEQNICI